MSTTAAEAVLLCPSCMFPYQEALPGADSDEWPECCGQASILLRVLPVDPEEERED